MINNKLLSGRFLLTIATAIVFVYLALVGRMEAKDTMLIITMVFTLYFTRNDRGTPPTQGGTEK